VRECSAALWPCAMTGAVSCLTGINGLGVVIHGASGCYFYPATILHRTIHCTFLVEEDIIFGAGERLRELISSLEGTYATIAVVNTCTPAITGEELQDMEGDPAIITIDIPGFMGTYETGFLSACRALPVCHDTSSPGVTIDGLSPLDPFYAGNRLEALRLLVLAGFRDPVLLSACSLRSLSHIPPCTITTNPDLRAGFGDLQGTFLGIDETVRAFASLQDSTGKGSIDLVEREAGAADDEITRVCDKYLQRFDPPSVAIFGESAYACFAANLLERALDASITCIGSRNPSARSPAPTADASTLAQVKDLIDHDPPDVVLGSSFERNLAPSSAFVPFTFPVRGMIRLRARSLIGIQGTLGLVEDVLNTNLDRKAGRQNRFRIEDPAVRS
jgi:nitrogenase molybdenum-iron protein alpha/beta subunit